MASKEFWNNLNDAAWHHMAEDWLEANREHEEEYVSARVNLAVCDMRFSHVDERLWNFILLTLSLAETEWQIGQIGIQLIEHLLGWYGDKYIAQVEKQTKINEKFCRAILATNQYMMTDEIWMRIKFLQEQIRFGKLPVSDTH